MDYKINGKSLKQMGVFAGYVNSADKGYPLKGVLDLPKRLGTTYHDWRGDIEPYVDADDIHIDARSLFLNVVCIAPNEKELIAKIDAFREGLPDEFTLSHDVLGEFVVGLVSMSVKRHLGRWAQLTLSLKECRPSLGIELPQKNNAPYGVDGYGWEQFGFVTSDMTNSQSITSWNELAITTNPFAPTWKAGRRSVKTATITGIIIAENYADFERKVRMLQTIFTSEGIRKLSLASGESIEGFAANGFTITNLNNLRPKHWGTFTCQITLL